MMEDQNQLALQLPAPADTLIGYCKVHGQVVPDYEFLLGTYHCPVCLNYVTPHKEDPAE